MKATYLHVGHFIPLERTADIIEVITGRRVSEGWISSRQTRISSRLDPFIAVVTAALRAAKTICCDETGFCFAGKRHWMHVCCTALLTLMLCHRRRGIDGSNALGVFSSILNQRPVPHQNAGDQNVEKTLSLLDRLRNRQTETLRFLHDRNVPWTNNQAERNIRPMKTQQKVSGGFRTESGAIEFCRIRSYLSTTAKNAIDPCLAIALTLAGKPWLPEVPVVKVSDVKKPKAKASAKCRQVA